MQLRRSRQTEAYRDAATEQRLKEVGRKVARLTRMLASKEARELLQLWEEVDE